MSSLDYIFTFGKLHKSLFTLSCHFLRLFFTGVLSYLVFNEIPNNNSIIGYFIIIVTGAYFIIIEGYKRGFKQKI